MPTEILQPSNDPRPLAIAKLMLAVAWVEGKLNHDDVLKIQRYLDSTIEMNDEDIHSFNLYHEYAVEPMERRRLARRFAQRFTSVADRREITDQLESLLPANKQNLNKTIAIQEIKEALVEDQINFIKKVKHKLTRTPFPARISDFGREAYLKEYKANPMLFRLKVRFGSSYTELGVSSQSAEKLCLEMSLIGLVVYADQILLPEELDLCWKYLSDTWKLKEKHVEMFVTMALCRETSEKQIPAFCRRYTELSNFDERQRVYLMLGEIARADHVVTYGEQHILEEIAKGLDIAPSVRRSVMDSVEHESVVN
ncbi:TerB family tellurite resistance protein [Cerasicoccus arenae]|uniref:Co-chaperone DjlA N-terminal domain-containing protein n=1 Tax=Cerasicoccus arenae TaxID=424488 RepID=A0A8J3D8D0_9BACT|nr:TerB family tellurite resistance protein [Cerasicoccus arenae]MBK1859492.1 TerB family tellurite resistance protein [Cerasicoccus arenae]GHB94955.1 hypothetical protein GCM10007047_08140 [Cerasicoccus arenae]